MPGVVRAGGCRWSVEAAPRPYGSGWGVRSAGARAGGPLRVAAVHRRRGRRRLASRVQRPAGGRRDVATRPGAGFRRGDAEPRASEAERRLRCPGLFGPAVAGGRSRLRLAPTGRGGGVRAGGCRWSVEAASRPYGSGWGCSGWRLPVVGRGCVSPLRVGVGVFGLAVAGGRSRLRLAPTGRGGGCSGWRLLVVGRGCASPLRVGVGVFGLAGVGGRSRLRLAPTGTGRGRVGGGASSGWGS